MQFFPIQITLNTPLFIIQEVHKSSHHISEPITTSSPDFALLITVPNQNSHSPGALPWATNPRHPIIDLTIARNYHSIPVSQ